jgi:hypothetical protein
MLSQYNKSSIYSYQFIQRDKETNRLLDEVLKNGNKNKPPKSKRMLINAVKKDNKYQRNDMFFVTPDKH